MSVCVCVCVFEEEGMSPGFFIFIFFNLCYANLISFGTNFKNDALFILFLGNKHVFLPIIFPFNNVKHLS